MESELSEMTAALDKEDSEETDLKKQLIEEKNKLDTYEASVKDNLAKTRHWKKEVCEHFPVLESQTVLSVQALSV